MDSRPSFLTPIAFALLGLSSCTGDQDPPLTDTVPPSTVGQSCGAGEAQILVQDGYLEDLCGCAEPAGKSYTQPAPLTCTVPAGTTVFLIFEGAVRPHQIISSGTPSFPSSTLWDPPNGNFINPHFAYQFSQTGTYAFFDAFDPAMTGSIISQ